MTLRRDTMYVSFCEHYLDDTLFTDVETAHWAVERTKQSASQANNQSRKIKFSEI